MVEYTRRNIELGDEDQSPDSSRLDTERLNRTKCGWQIQLLNHDVQQNLRLLHLGLKHHDADGRGPRRAPSMNTVFTAPSDVPAGILRIAVAKGQMMSQRRSAIPTCSRLVTELFLQK